MKEMREKKKKWKHENSIEKKKRRKALAKSKIAK